MSFMLNLSIHTKHLGRFPIPVGSLPYIAMAEVNLCEKILNKTMLHTDLIGVKQEVLSAMGQVSLLLYIDAWCMAETDGTPFPLFVGLMRK